MWECETETYRGVKSIAKKEHHGLNPTAILQVRQWTAVSSMGAHIQKHTQDTFKQRLAHMQTETEFKQALIKCILFRF